MKELKKDEWLTPDEYVEYTLTDLSCKKYDVLFGWKLGERIIRVSKWISGNGCGAKQAYFVSSSNPNLSPVIAWDDHVKEYLGQLELEI